MQRQRTRERQSGYIRKAKDKPCADCGVKYPHYVMDLDHNGQEKVIKIAQSVGRVSDERLLAEIAKCDVVCANCHRERTLGPEGEQPSLTYVP